MFSIISFNGPIRVRIVVVGVILLLVAVVIHLLRQFAVLAVMMVLVLRVVLLLVVVKMDMPKSFIVQAIRMILMMGLGVNITHGLRKPQDHIC